MPLNILIVEDEVLIAETIRLYLEMQQHTVSDICISYDEAMVSYSTTKPDLVILDIRLYGEKSGIDFAHYLQEQTEKTPFIFLTSQYDRRVFDIALKTNPYGYLAKPIQKESLWTTVETAYQKSKEVQTLELKINDGRKSHRVKEKDIIFIQSDHVYANIYLSDGRKIIARKSLTELLDELRGAFLFRCHRSYIINTKHIDSWDKSTITLSNGELVPISRSKRAELQDLI